MQKENLKIDHPMASPVLFMNRKEKKKFFQEINSKFADSMERIPQQMHKSKKILKFRAKF